MAESSDLLQPNIGRIRRRRYLDFALYINVAWLGAGMIWLSVFLINVTASHRRLEEKQRSHSRVRQAEHRGLTSVGATTRKSTCDG